MTEARTARELDEREQSERPQAWKPAATLPEPIKEAGYSYRWVRIAFAGDSDTRNLSSKLREGWEPVRVEEQPQFKLFADPDSRFKDNIEVGGLLLCKCPTEIVEQRAKYYADMNQAQLESVDNNFMRENDARMPLFREKKSSTSFGKGTK